MKSRDEVSIIYGDSLKREYIVGADEFLKGGDIFVRKVSYCEDHCEVYWEGRC